MSFFFIVVFFIVLLVIVSQKYGGLNETAHHSAVSGIVKFQHQNISLHCKKWDQGILHKVNKAAIVVLTKTFRNTSNASWISFTVYSHFLSLNQQAQYVSWINAFYFKQAYSEKSFEVQSLSRSSQHAMCYE